MHKSTLIDWEAARKRLLAKHSDVERTEQAVLEVEYKPRATFLELFRLHGVSVKTIVEEFK